MNSFRFLEKEKMIKRMYPGDHGESYEIRQARVDGQKYLSIPSSPQRREQINYYCRERLHTNKLENINKVNMRFTDSTFHFSNFYRRILNFFFSFSLFTDITFQFSNFYRRITNVFFFSFFSLPLLSLFFTTWIVIHNLD